jgi:hypothetical protein
MVLHVNASLEKAIEIRRPARGRLAVPDIGERDTDIVMP